jgi:hypothetical protein
LKGLKAHLSAKFMQLSGGLAGGLKKRLIQTEGHEIVTKEMNPLTHLFLECVWADANHRSNVKSDQLRNTHLVHPVFQDSEGVV